MKREYELSKGKRGAVIPLPPEKIRITIRLDRDIVDHFRARVREAHRVRRGLDRQTENSG